MGVGRGAGGRVIAGWIATIWWVGLLATPASAQWWNEISHFGRNKVNYQAFEWKVIETENFRVYYYQGEGDIARVASQMAEDAYARISRTLDYRLSQPVPLLVYDSHNDFEQTNATWGLIDESTLGFTEAFKNRVVVPFTGSYTQFRHVIHHELVHAVMFDMFYRRQGGLSTASQLWWGPPLWFAEGLAEYLSTDWTTEKNMWVRGATIDGYLRLDGYQAYTAGYSLLRWIADEFGADKIPAITRRMAITKEPAASFRAVLGVSLDDLQTRWERHLKRFYWPEIERRELTDEMGRRLTDHRKDRNHYNFAPAFSPHGDRIAFLSDRDDYASIYIMSAIDGRILRKVVTGERSSHFEEMHWSRGSLSWSPGGSHLVFAAKHHDLDALYIVSAENGRIQRMFRWRQFNALFSPSWSPDSLNIVFVGVREGRSDLYLVNTLTGELRQLTDDFYDEIAPRWSPDGTRIAFASDRVLDGEDSNVLPVGSDRNVFVMDVSTGVITQITRAEGEDSSPCWSPDGRRLAFTSDRNGIYNLYVADLDSGTERPLTNVIDGVFQPDWSRDGRKIAVAAFNVAGYDIFTLTDPLAKWQADDPLPPAEFLERRREEAQSDSSRYLERPPVSGLGHWRFSLQPHDSSGNPLTFVSKPYDVHFSPDLVSGLVMFDNINGLMAQTMLRVSDTMGDHQIQIYTHIYRNVEDADFQFAYYNLRKRPNWGFSLFQFHQYYLQSFAATEWTSDRVLGGAVLLNYPFNKFTRLETSLELSDRERANFSYDTYLRTPVRRLPGVRTLLPSFALINDNTLWGVTGPTNGSRSAFQVKFAPEIGFNTYAYTTLIGDYRKYLRVSADYALALRVSSGMSVGRNPGRFLLGGTSYWINFHYTPTYSVTNDSLIPITQFITPLRGSRFGELSGSRYALANIEFRYPLVRELAWGWPLPIVLRNIRGILFLDLGTVWGDGRGFAPFAGNGIKLNYTSAGMTNAPTRGPLAVGGFGFGWRMNLGVAVLRWDIAWPTDLDRTLGGSRQYWSLGADF